MASLKNKLTNVEISIGDILEWKDTIDQFVNDIRDMDDEMKESISVITKEVLKIDQHIEK